MVIRFLRRRIVLQHNVVACFDGDRPAELDLHNGDDFPLRFPSVENRAVSQVVKRRGQACTNFRIARACGPGQANDGVIQRRDIELIVVAFLEVTEWFRPAPLAH